MIKWTIDDRAVQRARRVLKLKHNVTVTLCKGFWAGSYTPLHEISVNRTQPVEEVSYILWHELGHAMQCERDYGGDGNRFQRETHTQYTGLQDSLGRPIWKRKKETYDEWLARYMSIPIEAEAEEIAKRYADRYPLIA